MKIWQKLKNFKFSLILLLIVIIVSLLFFEFRKQWERENGYLLPLSLLQKIKDAPLPNANQNDALTSIKIINLGDSIIKSDHYVKIIAQTKEEQWYSVVDSGYYYQLFVRQLTAEELGFEKSQLVEFPEGKELFTTKPLTFILSPILKILSSLSSILWITYLWRTRIFTKKEVSKVTDNQTNVTFKDVAGNEEEKEEMKELIDFLKQPQKYIKIGVEIPKGVLLEGPPGTGKTLLAKALAGEANVPFFATAGSEFVEKYVGVGASRIRKLFEEARDNAPCVLFIDEIDVLGGRRNSDNSAAAERDQTLNQLLTEMDGFTKSLGIIVVGATNRIDILDSALLRPGRFDRKILVSLPDVKAREAILKLHAQNKNISKDVNFNQLAKLTHGMSGAELAAVLNEACILTIRNQKSLVTMKDLDEAIDRVLMGPAKKSRKYSEEEKKETAYHEAGHAVIALKLKDADKVQKITIIPRGSAGGYNLMLPEKELFFHSKKRFKAKIISYLGGRAAEELVFGSDNTSSGCYDDFKQSTRIARLMVTKYGMSDLGPVQDSEFSDKKAIDREIKKIIDQCFVEAQTIMKDNRALLDKIANLLLEQETITKEEIDKLV